MKDASQNPIVAARLLNSEEEQKLKAELDSKYESLRASYNQKQESMLSLEEARKNKLNLFE
jgi:5-methyltetrahydrofolate--homocysteine methyltransferase